MIKFNKRFLKLDTRKIEDLGSRWKDHIPKRPDYPEGYFDTDEEAAAGNSGEGDDESDLANRFSSSTIV